VGDLVFACNTKNFRGRLTEYRGPQNQEYYEGDYQILPCSQVEVRIEKGLACTFPILNLQTRSDTRFRRAWSHIRRDRTDLAVIWFVKRGRLEISVDTHRHIIQAGECTITRSLQPFYMENLVGEDSINEVLHVVAPTHILRAYIPDAVSTGAAFSFRQGDCRVAERTLTLLYEEGHRVDRRVAEELVRAAFGALGNSMSKSVDLSAPSTLAEKRLHDIVDCIQMHLSNPDLTISSVAGRCGISTRYLCSILRSHETTFSDILWNNRLERTKTWLVAENMRHMPIAKIAYMAGFKSAAHFSRMFRRATGMAPRQYREVPHA
jgi:AraC family transcriptional activator of tynA and feaB